MLASVDDLSDNAGASEGEASDELAFSQGDWTVEPFAFALDGLDDQPAAELYGGGVGLNYYFKDGLAIRGELYGTGIDQTGDGNFGAGLNLLGRWHFIREPDWSLFAEGGGGLIQTDTSLPDGRIENVGDGTHFNFSSHIGVGATYRVNADTHLVGAFRFTHISNADIAGDDENPGINAIGGYVGLSFAF